MAVRTIKGIKAFQFGNVEWIPNPSYMTLVTQTIEEAINRLNVVETKIGVEIQEANKTIDEMYANNECNNEECLKEFAKLANVNVIVQGVLSLERGQYYLRLEVMDLRYDGNPISIEVTGAYFDEATAEQAKKHADPLCKGLFQKYIEPPIPEIKGKVYINTLDETGKQMTGVEVYINGIQYGLTPVYNEGLKHGKYKLDLKLNYSQERRTFVIDTTKLMVINIQILQPRGKIVIHSKPTNAMVYINDQKEDVHH